MERTQISDLLPYSKRHYVDISQLDTTLVEIPKHRSFCVSNINGNIWSSSSKLLQRGVTAIRKMEKVKGEKLGSPGVRELTRTRRTRSEELENQTLIRVQSKGFFSCRWRAPWPSFFLILYIVSTSKRKAWAIGQGEPVGDLPLRAVFQPLRVDSHTSVYRMNSFSLRKVSY